MSLAKLLGMLALAPLCAAADAYMKCYLTSDRPGPTTCYLPLVNATYACTLALEGPTCVTPRLEAITCRGAGAEVYCVPGARIDEDHPAHVTITGYRGWAPLASKKVVPAFRPSTRVDIPRRAPTIEELTRPPPEPTLAEQAMMDAADSAAAAAEAAAEAAGAAAEAARARGFTCFRQGRYTHCEPQQPR